jgi:hypothetical protein
LGQMLASFGQKIGEFFFGVNLTFKKNPHA